MQHLFKFLLLIASLTGVMFAQTTGNNDTIEWNELAIYRDGVYYWTVPSGSNWELNPYDQISSDYDSTADHQVVSSWIRIPTTAVNDSLSLVYYVGSFCRADYSVCVTTDGVSYDTLFRGLTSNMSYGLDSLYMGDYAGQTVRIVICHYGLTTPYSGSDLGCDVNDPYANGNIYINNLSLKPLALPKLSLMLSQKVFVGDTAHYEATLYEGSHTGLSIMWSSSLSGQVWTGSQVDYVYTTGGIDTITVVAVNAYGTDTAMQTVKVIECGTVTQMPWLNDFSSDFDCWRNLGDADWIYGTENETLSFIRALDEYKHYTLVSPAITLATDTAGLRLYWRDKRFNLPLQTYRVLVTTGDSDSLSAYETLYSSTPGTSWTQRSVSLAAYAGQTVHIAFDLVHSGSYGSVYISDVMVYSDRMPLGTMTAPIAAQVGNNIGISFDLTQGDTTGLSLSWHSALLNTSGVLNGSNGSYWADYMCPVSGMETVTVTASNAFGTLELSKSFGVFECDTIRNFPWEEEFVEMGSEASYNACWQMVGVSHMPFNVLSGFTDEDGTHLSKNDLLVPTVDGAYVITPPIAVPSMGVEHLALWVHHGGSVTVVASTQGDSALSLFNDTLLAYTGSEYRRSTVALAPYAGQTIQVLLTVGTLDRVAVDYDTLPKLNNIQSVRQGSQTPFETRTDSTEVYRATLRRGITTGATFSWHSSLMGISFTDIASDNSEFSLTYDRGGIDTITVIASNGYGIDTKRTTVRVIDCTPTVTLPWSENFAYGDICWYKPDGSNWHVGVPSNYPNEGSYRAIVSATPADSTEQWIVSKAIVLPADPNSLPTLFWDVASTNNNQPRYSVLVSTATDPTDLASFSLLYTDTTGIVNGGYSWSNHTSRNINLSAYAGDTIHIAFCNQPVTGNTCSLLIDNVKIRFVAQPLLSLTASSVANSHETVCYDVSLVEGSNNGLSIRLHSSLLDTTFVGQGIQNLYDTASPMLNIQFPIYYTIGGIDTVKVIASNAYGADTITRVVTVSNCLISELPWMEEFSSTTAVSYSASNGKMPNCWHRYWNGSNANYAPHVIGNYLSNTAIRTYCLNNHALLLMAGSSNGWDSVATVESPIFDDNINGKLLSFYYMYEDANYGLLSVGYMQDSTFVGIAEMEPQAAGRTEAVCFAGIPVDVNRFALRWEKGGNWYGAIVDSIQVTAPDTLPSVRINAPETAFVGDNNLYKAVLTNGLADNLTFTWHSTMLDTTITLNTQRMILNYQSEGLDTVTLVVSTAYGSDSAMVVVTVASHPLPQITLTVPQEVYANEVTVIGATINSCSGNGLGYTWHSTLLDSTWSGNMSPSSSPSWNIMYTDGGIDTLVMVVTNIFGTDTDTAIVRVYNCQGYSLPYHEDFSTVLGTFPYCWSYQWDGGSQRAPHIVSSGNIKYLQMQAGGYDDEYSPNYHTNTSIVTLPRFNDTLNRYVMALRFRTSNAYYGSLSVGYMSGDTFVTYATLTNTSNVTVTDTIALDELPDSVNQLAIRWHQANTSSSYTLSVYEIDIFAESYVRGPNNLHIDSLGAQCVRLAWNPMLDATAYSVQIEGVGETVVTTTFAEMCGLAPNTQYTARVACLNGNDTGNYVAIQFTTLCNIVELPWFEDFEGTSPLQCWSQQGGGYISLPSSDFGFYYNAFAHSGTNFLFFDNNSHERSGFAVSPQIDFPGDELIVSFWACSHEIDSVEAGVFTVQGDTTSFVPMVFCQLTSTPTRYEFDTRNLTEDYLSIAFRLRGHSYGVFIDDITVERIQECARLRSVSSYPVGATSAVVEWQYDTASAIPNTGALVTLTDLGDSTVAPMVVTVAGNSHTFTGLALSHRYQASVQALCANDTTVALTTLVVPSGNVCAERSGSYSHWWSMINCDRPYSYSQTLYPAVLAATIDTLYGIAYHITSSSVEQYPNSYNTYSDGPRIVDVFIGQTSFDTLTSPVSASNLTLAVQNYELSVADTGWVRINFTNPIPLDGVSNLIVTVDDNTGALYGHVSFSHHTDSPGVRFHTSSANYSYTQTYDPYNPGSFNPLANMQIPDIQLLGGCSGDRCLQPLVTVTDEDTHSVSLAWQQRGSESLWRIEYHVEGDSIWVVAGTTSNTSYTIGGLNASTGYRVRVASLCSGQAVYSDSHRVHTSCGVVTLPYYQTFRADYMPSTQSSIDENGIPCWQTGDITLLSQERGLWNTHQNGDYIISPEIDFPLYGVKVDLSASGSTFFLSGLKVGICAADGSNLEWMDTITLTDNPQVYSVFFNDYTGDERHIAIGGSYESWTLYDVYIDNINSCIPVHHVSLGYVDDTSIIVHWPPIYENNRWAVYMDSTLLGVTNDTMFAIGNLAPSSSHTVGVREVCNAGDTSVATLLDFTTLCAASLPWNEAFDGGVNNQVPNCWHPIFRPSVGFTNKAYILGDNNNPYLYFYDYYSPYHDFDTMANFICSPVFCTNGRGVNVSFSARKGSSGGLFQAGIMTNPIDTSSFIPMVTLTSYSQSMINYQFTTDSMTLPGKYCLAFRSWGATTCSVDDISVSLIPLPSYTVATAVNDTTMGSVIGAGVYEEGTLVTITAIPNEGYHFLMWNDGITTVSRTERVVADAMFTAYFEADSVPPVIIDTVWYTVTIDAVMDDGSDEDLTDMVSGAGVYAEGATVTLEGVVQGCATSFIYWLTEVGDTIFDNPYSFVISSDVNITAVFGHYGSINNPWNQETAEPLVIYPNPAVSTVIVSGLQPGSRFTIIDVNGRIVDDFETESDEIKYDVSRLPQGVYYFRSATPSSTRFGKLIRK